MLLQIMLILMTTSTIAYKCSLDFTIALCSNEGWTKIPTGQQERVVILNLSENNIQKINEGDLDRFERLESLYIDNCKLESVGRTAFKQLRQLSYVDLSHNRLSYIDNDMFQHNNRLADLVLSGNQLQPHKFSPILISASIQTLKMRNCGIRKISSVMFSKLEKLRQLDLSKNNILTISDGAFDRKHLENVCLDPDVFSKIRSKAATVDFTTYYAAENECRFYNVQKTPDNKKETSTLSSTSVMTFQSSYTLSTIQPTKKKETSTLSSTSVMTFQSSYTLSTIQPTNRASSEADTAQPSNVTTISRKNDANLSENANNTFGLSIGNGEMYTIMAVSMLVGAGLCYALIGVCRKRRRNVPNRVLEPPPGFVGTGPDSTSWMHPVVYKIVPQYELEYPNDMYELPRPPTRHSYELPVHLSLPSYNPPLPPRPPRMSVSSHHEYEYIQSPRGDVPTSS